jgi:hypothetical protein
MCAILTPSTKGLRQSLKDINFTMPLAPQSTQSLAKKSEMDAAAASDASLNASESMNNPEEAENSVHFSLGPTGVEEDLENQRQRDNSMNETEKKAAKSKAEENEEEDDEEKEEDDSDEPDEWLEQIGLNSAVNFKASVLQRNSKNQQKDSLYNFDNRPRSALYFDQSSDVQALFNFLLNSKTCIMNSGPMSGVPPTLIAPTAFLGATLQKNRVEQNIIKSLTDNNIRLTQYAIDLTGPIMPLHVHRLCNLFRVTQDAEFEMTAITYDQSQSLNCVHNRQQQGELKSCESSSILSMSPTSSSSENSNDHNPASVGIDNAHLDVSEAKSLTSKYGVYGTSASIRTICCKEEKFCCNV